MDAVEFVKQWRRMGKNGGRKYSVFNDEPEDVVTEVEEWAKENPVKTRQSEFLKLFPNAECTSDGKNIIICPKRIDTTFECCGEFNTNGCFECRRNYWLIEVE